jgi:DNA-binding CsgD family transcriptional regulator
MPHGSPEDEARNAWGRQDPASAVRLALDAARPGEEAASPGRLVVDASTVGDPDRMLRLACWFAVRGRRADLLLPHLDRIGALPASVLRDAALAVAAIETGDPARAVALALSAADAPPDVADVVRGDSAPAADAAPHDTADSLRAAVLAEVAFAAIGAGRWMDARRCVESARAVLARIPPDPRDEPTRFDLRGIAAVAELHTDAGDDAFTALTDALAPLRLHNTLTAHHALALVCLGDVEHLRGQLGEAAVNLARGARLMDASRPRLAFHARIELAFVRVRQGRWDDADRLLAEAGDSDIGAPADAALLAMRGLMQGLRGRLDQAAPLIEPATALARATPSALASIVLLHVQVAASIARNDWAALRRALDDAEEPGYRHPYSLGEWNALSLLAAWHLGSRAEFARRLTAWSLVPESQADPYFWAFAAIKAEDERRLSDGLHAIERALASLSPTCDPLGRTWVRMVAGTYIGRYGQAERPDPVRALEVYEDASAELRQLGDSAFAPLCDRIIEDVTAELDRARRLHPASVLTEQQRRIAVAVAQGYTSEEIASILQLSKRTIDYHVTNILRRLGITTRREIGRLLAEHP